MTVIPLQDSNDYDYSRKHKIIAADLEPGDILSYAHREVISVEPEPKGRLHVICRTGNRSGGYDFWHYHWMLTTPIIIWHQSGR